jgi:hypothetical protein
MYYNHRSLRRLTYEIKTDALTPAESQNNFPAVSAEDAELMATLYHNLHKLHLKN